MLFYENTKKYLFIGIILTFTHFGLNVIITLEDSIV